MSLPNSLSQTCLNHRWLSPLGACGPSEFMFSALALRRYYLQKVKLGEGSFGTVWRAVDRRWKTKFFGHQSYPVKKTAPGITVLSQTNWHLPFTWWPHPMARHTNTPVAVKQLDKAVLPKRGVRRADIEREISVMQDSFGVRMGPVGFDYEVFLRFQRVSNCKLFAIVHINLTSNLFAMFTVVLHCVYFRYDVFLFRTGTCRLNNFFCRPGCGSWDTWLGQLYVVFCLLPSCYLDLLKWCDSSCYCTWCF